MILVSSLPGSVPRSRSTSWPWTSAYALQSSSSSPCSSGSAASPASGTTFPSVSYLLHASWGEETDLTLWSWSMLDKGRKEECFLAREKRAKQKKTVMPTISMCINRGKPGYWITLCFYPPRCPLVLILIQHSMWNYFSICCLLSTHRTSQHPLHQPWHDRPAQCWARISAGLLGELCAGPHTDLEVEGQRGGDTWIGL